MVNGLLPNNIQSYIEAAFEDNYLLKSISGGKLKVKSYFITKKES